MSDPFRSKEFLRLKDEWDKKLKDSGFEDIEKTDRRTGEAQLQEWHSQYFLLRNTPEVFDSKHEYYLQAEHFLHSGKFKSKTDRQIWQQHARGLGVRQIAEFLKDRGVRTNKDYVASTVKRLKRVMKEATKEECKNENSLQLDLWHRPTKDSSL